MKRKEFFPELKIFIFHAQSWRFQPLLKYPFRLYIFYFLCYVKNVKAKMYYDATPIDMQNKNCLNLNANKI